MTVGVLRSQFVTSKTGSIYSLCLFLGWRLESNLSSRSFWRNHQLPDRIDQILNRRVMCIESLFKFPNFRSNLSICCQHLSHFYESPYDKQAHLYGTFGVQYCRSHNRAMLSKSIRCISTSPAPAF